MGSLTKLLMFFLSHSRCPRTNSNLVEFSRSYGRYGMWGSKSTLWPRVAEPELEPALFGSSGAGALDLLRLRTKLKKSFLNGRKYIKVSKKYAESADM